MDFLVISISMLALIIASYMDFKKREVADWLNYSLIVAGIGINLIYSVYFWNHEYILYSLIGFIFSIGLAYLMFYTGQWGGGDSKMLMGLGALLGLRFSIESFLLKFYINILFAGAIYGLVWVFILAVIHRKKLFKKINKITSRKKNRIIRTVFMIIVLVLLLSLIIISDNLINPYLKLVLFSVIVFLYFLQYLWILVKAIEKIAMIKAIPVDELTEGDWIVDDVIIDNERICGPKDLGIEKKQIEKLIRLKQKGKINTIVVKQGIPFVPSFLIAFVYTLVFQNVVFVGMII